MLRIITLSENHQGKFNVRLFPQVAETRCDKAVECRERLGGSRATTTETPRELTTKSRSIAMRLWLGGAETNAWLMARLTAN
jgi:hypothetical protein